jgi:hypothetical protein
MSRRLLAVDTLPNVAAGVDASTADQKVVKDYLLPDGRLKTIPSQRKKLLAILRYIAQAFEPGRRYSEKEVNEILGRYHEDTASLRRELVGSKLMGREGGGRDYWREGE